MTRERTARDRLIVRVERAGAALGVLAIVLMVGVGIVVRRRGGVESDAIPRPAVEQRAMLANGECALRPNREVAGKLVRRLDAGRDRPNGALELEAIDRRQAFEVDAAEVAIVPCVTLQR